MKELREETKIMTGDEMSKDRKTLDQLTKEDYQKPLMEIQGALAECVGELIILGGYLESDLSLDSENTHYVLIAARDIIEVACKSVKKALSYTYPML